MKIKIGVLKKKSSISKNQLWQKKDAYYDAINKYLQKIDEQRRKLLILHEEAIENYKAFKRSHTNENNGLTVIDTSLK